MSTWRWKRETRSILLLCINDCIQILSPFVGDVLPPYGGPRVAATRAEQWGGKQWNEKLQTQTNGTFKFLRHHYSAVSVRNANNCHTHTHTHTYLHRTAIVAGLLTVDWDRADQSHGLHKQRQTQSRQIVTSIGANLQSIPMSVGLLQRSITR